MYLIINAYTGPFQQQPGAPTHHPSQYGQSNNPLQIMNPSGPRQYPGGPMKPIVNGDNGPHLPPTQNQFQAPPGKVI